MMKTRSNRGQDGADEDSEHSVQERKGQFGLIIVFIVVKTDYELQQIRTAEKNKGLSRVL